MYKPALGVISLYYHGTRFEEMKFLTHLTIQGRKLGLNVFVFSPADVNHETKQVYAHLYHPNRKIWYRKMMPIPKLIFDRTRYQKSEKYNQMQRFRKMYANIHYLNRPMANKWRVHESLRTDRDIEPHLPDTILYQSRHDLIQFLRKWETIYLKPINGTGGRGILRVTRTSKTSVLIAGRDQHRKIIAPYQASIHHLIERVRSISSNQKYILQQGIDLQLKNGRVHDFRLLVQKNRQGTWEVTGCVGRVGPTGSVTSNLHGGGRAIEMDQLLRANDHSQLRTITIKEKVNDFGLQVAKKLEKRFSTLCELALDIAVDADGAIWLIEVNPKPAREVFYKIGQKEVYRTAISRPLEYALWYHEKYNL